MTAYLHRVDPRVRDKPAPLVLPRDVWCGREFVEADGTVDTVVWNGACRWPPSDCGRRQPSHCDVGNDVPGGGAV